jgi:hypothetical protein
MPMMAANAALTAVELLDAMCTSVDSVFDVRAGNLLLATATIARPRLCNDWIDRATEAADLGSVCLTIPKLHPQRVMASIDVPPSSIPPSVSVVNVHQLLDILE